MKTPSRLLLSAFAALAALAVSSARADNLASIAITPATGAVALTPQWSIGPGLAGFHEMAQDLSVGGGANQFYSIKAAAIPAGGDISAFVHYIAASGAATPHADIGSKLTPTSYSALSSADPDVGYGAVNFYLIHHKSSGDYFTVIVPSSGVASAVTDLKPMSGPGGPATLGASGYFGLTFAAANLGYGLNLFYYLRTDPNTGFAQFGTLDPALLGTSADKFNLGIGGFNYLTFTGTDVGYGANQMYYLRLDPITHFTILGTLNPLTGRVSDAANLGSVYSTLDFVPGDVGFGTTRFYATGSINPTGQVVSFAAIADRLIGAGSFTVTPSASSALPIALTVVAGSVGSASISGPVAGVFTVTPTAPGLITLQATQAGATSPTPFEFNMLRQSFTASGATLLAVTSQPTSQLVLPGTTATFSVGASGTTAVSYQWQKSGANIVGNPSATTATLSLPSVGASDAASYDVVVTNASGSVISNQVQLNISAPVPVITSASLAPAGAVGTPFSFTITASGSATIFTASPLPAGLSLAINTGVISGTPTTAGTTVVALGAGNFSGTGTSTLTISVAAAVIAPPPPAAPVITSPATAGGTAGAPFVPYQIAATGVPTTYAAVGLPAGLTLNAATGAITGTPTVAGTFVVTLTATNAGGSTSTSLTITLGAAAASGSSRIVNFSLQAFSGPGIQNLDLGFVLSGDGKSLLIRGIGPTLASFGISNVLADPLLSLYSGNTLLITDDNWETSSTGLAQGASVATAAFSVGAFALPSGSKDSAVLTTLNHGAYTATVAGQNNGSGVAMAEVYDADLNPVPRLLNVSARMTVGGGAGSLVAGFVIAGNAPKTVLIRGVGPTLAAFGVTGTLADPQLTVFSGGAAIANNDNWETGASTAAQISGAAAQVGAFALPSGSKDAAVLVTLQPGMYTAQLSGVGTANGIALIEIYDVQ